MLVQSLLQSAGLATAQIELVHQRLQPGLEIAALGDCSSACAEAGPRDRCARLLALQPVPKPGLEIAALGCLLFRLCSKPGLEIAELGCLLFNL